MQRPQTARCHGRAMGPPALGEGDARRRLMRRTGSDARPADPGIPLVRRWALEDHARSLTWHRREDREEARIRGAGDPHLFADASRSEWRHTDDDRAPGSADDPLGVVEADLQLVADVDLCRVCRDDHRDGMQVVQADARRVRHLHPETRGCSAPASDDEIDGESREGSERSACQGRTGSCCCRQSSEWPDESARGIARCRDGVRGYAWSSR